jgi:hypothetical protein
MKTLLSLFIGLTVLFASASFATKIKYGKTEVLKPSIGKAVRAPFNEVPKTIKFGSQNPLAGLQQKLSYYDESSINEGHIFPLITPRGPLLDENGDPIISNNGAGSEFHITGYSTRFTTTLANPKLDSVRIWFFVDSMEDLQGNALEVGVVKQRFVEHNDGVERPHPDLGDNGAIGTYTQNHKPIARNLLKVGTGEVNSRKVSFAALALPEQDFCVYLNSRLRVYTSQTEFVVYTNAITAIGDSINIEDLGDLDPEVFRNHNIALDDDAGFYTTNYNVYSSEDGSEVYAPNMQIIAYVRDPTAAVEDIDLEGDALAQNYPNPFNPSTNVAFSLATGGQASLKVYNALGNEVASLVDGFKGAGKHEVMFDASELPSGTYYYTLKSGSFTSTKRMVLSK